MYICIDFDGTIVDHVFPDIGEPVPHAIEFMKHFQVHGGKLILFTMRSDGLKRSGSAPVLTYAVDYLKSHDIELYGVNKNPTQHTWTNSPKAYGNMYIDDAAVGVPLIQPEGFRRPCVDWSKVGPLVLQKLMT